MAVASWLCANRGNRIKLYEEYIRATSVVQHLSQQSGQTHTEVRAAVHQHVQDIFLEIKGALAAGLCPQNNVRSSAPLRLWKGALCAAACF